MLLQIFISNSKMFIYLLCLSFTQWPNGSYKAVINPILLPKQEIVIKTFTNKQGLISLKGAVNFNDKFKYDFVNGQWQAYYSDEFIKNLKKYHCTINDISFDSDHDQAVVSLSFPIISKIVIRMDKYIS